MQDITIGAHELCAWKVAPGVVWVQTRNWQIADTLSKRMDARVVVRGCCGGYLKTFEFTGKDMGWARSLIRRLPPANEPILDPNARSGDLDSKRVSPHRAA